MVKNLPANAGDVRDMGYIPGLGRSSGGGHGNPLQVSFLENPIDRRAWWATVHRVTKSQTQLKRLSKHTPIQNKKFKRPKKKKRSYPESPAFPQATSASLYRKHLVQTHGICLGRPKHSGGKMICSRPHRQLEPDCLVTVMTTGES